MSHEDMIVDALPDAATEQSRELAVVPPTQPAPLTLAWTPEDEQALRETVAKDCNAAQFKVFVAACYRLRLDPFARQIVPIVQGQRMTPQVTIDGFRLIAERTRLYGGQIGPFWCGPDGEWRDVWLSDGDPVAAKVGVIRRDFKEPLWGVARTKAYKQNSSPTWGRMADVMIAKVAESLALRKAFPQELSGVYTREEMEQAQDDSDYTSSTPVQAASTPTSRQATTDTRVPHRATPAPAQPQRAANGTPTIASLFERAKKIGVPPAEWLAAKKRIGNDVAQLADWLNGYESELQREGPDATEAPQEAAPAPTEPPTGQPSAGEWSRMQIRFLNAGGVSVDEWLDVLCEATGRNVDEKSLRTLSRDDYNAVGLAIEAMEADRAAHTPKAQREDEVA